MPYSGTLANRIREALMHIEDLEEKAMFSGMCFMVNGKMCICVNADGIMCRVDPDRYDELMERPGTRPMDMKGKPMKGYLYVDTENIKKKSELDYWIKLCLDYNPKAKASKKRK